MSKVKSALKLFFDNIDLLALVVFGIFIGCYLIDSTVIAKNYEIMVTILKVARYSCYGFFAVKVTTDILRERKISIVMVAAVAASLGVLICAKNITFAFAVLMLCALRSIDIKRVAKWCFFIMGSLFFAVVVLALVGIIPDWTFAREEVIRHSLGFTYPTDAFAVYLVVVILGVVAFGTKTPYIVILVAEAVNYGLYWYTDGRLSFILVTVLLLAVAVLKLLYSKVNSFECFVNKILTNKAVGIVLLCVPFLFLIGSVVLVLMYKNNVGIAVTINQILSDRLIHSSKAMSNYPLLPFGTFVEWKGFGGIGYAEAVPEDFVNTYNFVDISYIRGLFDFGIIPTVAIVTGYGLAIKKFAQKKELILVVALLATVLWCFVEPFIFTIGKNVMVVCLAQFMNNCNITVKPLSWLGDKFEKILE